MNIIKVRNVHRALPLALQCLHDVGTPRPSRNGPVTMVENVCTEYTHPCERVIFWPERDANPFFHFFESLWMLGGRNDVASVSRFAENMSNYTDDGKTFHGAYGYRWRHQMDQLKDIGSILQRDRNDRRCVLQMWDSMQDLGHDGKDVPCNVTATLQVGLDGRLNLTVLCRSNDIVWGAYGANAVQFSTMLEYVAIRAGLQVGTYHQVSVNWHGYATTFSPLYDKMLISASQAQDADKTWTGTLDSLMELDSPYEVLVRPYPLAQEGTDMDQWDLDLQRLLRANGRCPTEGRWCDPFFTDVAIPLLQAHDIYKEQKGTARYVLALSAVNRIAADDWRLACSEWISRRYDKYKKENP